MAVPYRRSQTAGSADLRPASNSAVVSNPPTTIGGAKLRRNLRPGPEKSAAFARCALVAAVETAMATATKASSNQTPSQARGEDCWEAGAALCDVKHFRLLTRAQEKRLLPRDEIELRADDLVQYENTDRVRARKY